MRSSHHGSYCDNPGTHVLQNVTQPEYPDVENDEGDGKEHPDQSELHPGDGEPQDHRGEVAADHQEIHGVPPVRQPQGDFV